MPRRKKLHEATPSQLKIQLEVVEMPPVEQYPTNFEQSVKLEKFIVDDFLTSSSFTIITGFTTLDKIIGFVSTHQSKNGQCRTNIVLGNEPIHYVKDTTRLKKHKLELKIKDYWLEKGISVTLCSGIIHLIQLIRSGQVNFKILDNLHAKLFVGDNYAVLGSSNFSNSGLRNNLEANLRKEKGSQEYQDIKLIASTYKEKAKDYNQEVIQLLEELLQFVSWQEALAKAAAEILESKWLKQYPQVFQMLSSLHLWESQIQAIGQALYIFDNFGDGLLIADPTGSGKTRLGAALQLAIINRQWSQGKGNRTNTSILCPPSVIDNWHEEFLDLGTYAPAMISHGQMSRWVNGTVKINDRYLDKAHLLLVDEAHNFLNAKSNRSTAMQRHSADNVVLFTATPINRKLEDIFRLIEILDVDNLSDESIKELESIRRNRSLYSTSSTAFKHLKRQLGNFTIRRTKQDLNKLIQQSPEKYYRIVKQDGKEVKIKCRYPDPVSHSYPSHETEKDVEIAYQIDSLCNELKGLLYLKKLKFPSYELDTPEKQENALAGRMQAATALAKWNVMAYLRSSRAALLEHLQGSANAAEYYKIDDLDKDKTGNIIAKLQKRQLPITNLTIDLPAWLSEEKAHLEAIREEVAIYKKIADLSKMISDQREKARASLLIKLVGEHQNVIAFDSKIISLFLLEQQLKELKPDFETMLVTGKTNKKPILEAFHVNAPSRKVLGLCSDTMSEGVNLQKASALVLLNMPSVMRVAEQRIGRIDRMNSPYEKIYLYWPEDHDAFTLKTDEKFFKTAQVVDSLLGGNIDIPEELTGKLNIQPIKGSTAIKYYQQSVNNSTNNFSDSVQDAFLPVKELVSGSESIVPPSTYEEMKNVTAKVVSFVSVVRSSSDWAFFSIKGIEGQAPQWLLINEKKEIIRDLPSICRQLRERLAEAQDVETISKEMQEKIDAFVNLVSGAERSLMPHKKRRALELLEEILQHYLKHCGKDEERYMVIQELLKYLANSPHEAIDYQQFALEWIDIIRERYAELKSQKFNRRTVLHMKSRKVKKALKDYPVSTSELAQLRDSLRTTTPMHERIGACIVGVSKYVSPR